MMNAPMATPMTAAATPIPACAPTDSSFELPLDDGFDEPLMDAEGNADAELGSPLAPASLAISKGKDAGVNWLSWLVAQATV